jgi:hypothetical protein
MVCAVFMAADAVEVVGDTLGEVLQSGDRAADGVSVLAVVTNNCFSICVAFYLIFSVELKFCILCCSRRGKSDSKNYSIAFKALTPAA